MANGGHQRGDWGTAGATAPLSSNIAAQLASGRGEAWVDGAGKARYLSRHRPSSHTSCAPWIREKGHAAEACWPHDAVAKELRPMRAAGCGTSPGGDGAPIAVQKPSSVLQSRE